MTFFAQFRIPWEEGRMAFLFVDVRGENWHSDGGDAVLLIQPGQLPPTWEERRIGPTYVSERSDLTAYRPRMRRGLLERVPLLAEGADPERWPEEGPDTDFDWNKVGGTARYLQGEDGPSGAGWRSLFQFTAALVGHEFGDGAECYGFVSDDGRAAFLWQSH
jgi:hypothetical protein